MYEGPEMTALQYWIKNGKMALSELASNTIGPEEERVRFNAGEVRLTTGSRGTELKWYVLSPCNASLFAATVVLEESAAPYVLRFYASGWFEEFHQTKFAVNSRIEQIIACGDRHFTCHTLVKEFETKGAPLSPMMEQSICGEAGDAADYSVECVLEEQSGKFHVARIGKLSAIAKVYGTFLSSFPCRPSGAYGDTVSAAYAIVLNSGQSRFDQILAAMRMPNNQVHWVPYSRLVSPILGKRRNPAVMVISEIGQVDIQLI
jgi:hypothetical protein